MDGFVGDVINYPVRANEEIAKHNAPEIEKIKTLG